MGVNATVATESAHVDVVEAGRHAIVKVIEPRPLPERRLQAVSVFVHVDAGADVAVSVNGVWWRSPDSDPPGTATGEASGRSLRLVT